MNPPQVYMCSPSWVYFLKKKKKKVVKETEKQQEKRHETQRTKHQNVRCKSNYINDNIEHEWVKQSNQKEIIRLDLKNKKQNPTICW